MSYFLLFSVLNLSFYCSFGQSWRPFNEVRHDPICDPSFQSQAAVTVVTMDTTLRELVRKRIPNNVERRGQTASTSFNIHDNKRNAEWLSSEVPMDAISHISDWARLGKRFQHMPVQCATAGLSNEATQLGAGQFVATSKWASLSLSW